MQNMLFLDLDSNEIHFQLKMLYSFDKSPNFNQYTVFILVLFILIVNKLQQNIV